jgi:putative ABC transport system permease protein
MRRATLKNLLAHKLRMALTTLSVVLGVAFIAGTLVLTDTMNATFDTLFGEANENTSVAVRAEAAFSTGDGSDQRENVPAALVEQVAAVEGVDHAVPYVEGYAAVVGEDGDVVGTGQAPALGVNWVDSEVLSPLKSREGRAPSGAGEVALDATSAEDGGIAVGDRVQVLLEGPAREMEVVGIFSFGETNSLAGATMAAFDTATAQEVLTGPGEISHVVVRAEEGVAQDELAARVQAAMPAGIEAITGEALAEESSASIKEALSFFTYFLLTFAIIALFVGSFIIFNTFSMLVAQRTRELGLLRAVGASRGQITRSVMLEALVIGLIGSIVGLGAGVGVASALRWLMGLTGAELPSGSLVFSGRTVVWGFAVGVGVTLVAAVLPARRASTISPVAALGDQSQLPAGSMRRRIALGSALGVAGVAMLAAGLTDSVGTPVLWVGLGVAAVFLATTTLSPLISRPLVRVLALPLPRLFSTSGRLSRENALRNPRRTSATAGALMIGLALVSAFTVLGSSLKESFASSIDSSIGADFVLGTENYMPMSTEVAARVAEVDGVAEVGTLRWGVAKFGEGEGRDWLSAVQPSTLDSLMTVEMIEGSEAALAQDQLLVSRMVSDAEGWTVGQELPAEFAATGETTIVLGGIYEPNPMAGDYLISTALHDRSFSDRLDSAVMLRWADDVDVAAATAAVQAQLEAFPNVRMLDQAAFSAEQQGFVDTILALVTALLALAVLIAMFGIVNTLALSVFERTHEIGLLRAVGMSRRQLRRMIRLESVLISTFGAVLGLALGTAFGWAIVRAMSDLGVRELVIPYGSLALYLVLAALAGVLAAMWPARRAAKMDVLGAIATT